MFGTSHIKAEKDLERLRMSPMDIVVDLMTCSYYLSASIPKGIVGYWHVIGKPKYQL